MPVAALIEIKFRYHVRFHAFSNLRVATEQKAAGIYLPATDESYNRHGPNGRQQRTGDPAQTATCGPKGSY